MKATLTKSTPSSKSAPKLPTAMSGKKATTPPNAGQRVHVDRQQNVSPFDAESKAERKKLKKEKKGRSEETQQPNLVEEQERRCQEMRQKLAALREANQAESMLRKEEEIQQLASEIKKEEIIKKERRKETDQKAREIELQLKEEK